MLFAELFRVSQWGTRSGGRGGRRLKRHLAGWRPLRVESLEDRTLLDAVRWLGGSGNWSDAAKWSGHVPGASDTAIIDAVGSNYTVTLDINATVAGFTLSSATATFSASGRVFTVNGTGTLSSGTVSWRSSMWTGTGPLTNSVTMAVSGSSTILSPFVQGGSLQAQDSANLTLDTSWSNRGSLSVIGNGVLSLNGTWSSPGQISAATGSTVELNGTLNNAGNTLTLSGAGTWHFNNAIHGGTVTFSSGAKLTARSGASLDGVTLNGGDPTNFILDMANLPTGGFVTVTHGLTLNGTAYISRGSNWAALRMVGTQTLSGTGIVNLDGFDPRTAVAEIDNGTTLTIGPGITISGGFGTVGYQSAWSSSTNVSFINQGTILAPSGPTFGRTLTLDGSNWSNTGSVQASNGGSLSLNGTWSNRGNLGITGDGLLSLNGTWSSPGPISAAAGTPVELNGTLNNGGNTLALSGAGTWHFNNAIHRGTVAFVNGAKLKAQSGASLDGVTLNGGDPLNVILDMSALPSGGYVTVTNGLTLNGRAQISAGGNWAALRMVGTQTLGGNGQVGFDGFDPRTAMAVVDGGTTLTIGPNITILGGFGTVGYQSAWSSGTNVSFINQGTIQANSGSATFRRIITLDGSNWTNTGSIQASDGGSLSLNGAWSNRGNLGITGDGTLNLNGTWSNAGVVQALSGGSINAFGDWSNSGTLTVNGGIFHVSQSGSNLPLMNTGIIDAEAGTFAITAGGLRLDGSGVLRSTSGATINISGNLVGNTTNADLFTPAGTVALNGPGTATSPQLLGVLSRDLGNVSQGFTRNFGYGALTLANGTYVRLVNNLGGTRVLYVNSLIVSSGTTLDLNGLHVFARVTQNNGTILGGTVNQPPPGPLPLGVSAAGFIANDQQVDEWTFFGRAGQAVSAIVNTNPGLNFAHVRLLNPNNGVLGDQTNSQGGADVSFLGQPLPLDGTYRVQVSAGHAGSRGNYLLTVWNATITNSPLNLNQTITGQIDTPYRLDRWTFAAAANTPIQFVLVNASSTGLRFDLAGPSGYSRSMLHNGDLVTLPYGGNYVLSVSGVGQQTGAYSFRVRQTTVTDLTLGTPFMGAFDGSGQAQVFRVNVPQAKQMLVVLRDSNNADHNELYAKFGSAPTRADYDYRFSTPAAANQQILTPTAAPGSWYILVYGDLVQTPNHFTLQANTSTVFVTGLTPDHAANTAIATLTLTGSGFNARTAVSPVAGSGTVYPAATTSIDLPTQITATFTAGTVPAGVYTLRASQTGGDTFNLPGAFTMIAGGQPHLNTDVVVPGSIGYHGTATIYVDYSNSGNVAMPAPLLVLDAIQNTSPPHVREGAFLTQDQSLVIQGFWTSAVPDGFSHSVQILASGATPGVLQPGESVRVPVYYAGWQQPWDFAYPPIQFNLSVLTPDDSRTVDWTSMKDSLRPPGINSLAWEPIFANLLGAIGNTWGGYVNMLDSNASYLGRLGEKVTDVSRLWNFQVQQAIGFSTISTLGDSVDAQVTQPGLPLTFDRFFTPSLIGRNQLGVLGWGWTWAGGWQRTLTVASDGTVTIADTDGSQRRFQPDSRGGYFDQAGDMGTLRNLGGGVFSLQELDGLVTRFRADGRVDSVADTNNNRITAGYTGMMLTSLTHSAGQMLQIHYNAAGRIDKVTDSANRTTMFNYDPTNQYLMTVTTFDGLITRYAYDQSSDLRKQHALLSIESPGSTHQFFGYNTQGFINDMHKDGNAEQVTFVYGPGGKVAATDAAMPPNTTQYFFDYQGLLAKVVDPSLNATELSYDSMFDLTQLVDPAGQQYRYQYDSKGNLIRSTDPLGNTVGFAYAGPYDRLSSVTDAKGYQTQYRYDPQGNLLSILYADNASEQFMPNAAGDPIQWTNARGTPIKYERDSAGRVRKVTYADGSHVDYNYDPVRGTLLSAADASGTTMLLYQDAQHPDRVTKVVYPGGRFMAYHYDDAGRRDQMTDQGGFVVKYHYDAVGRLDKLLDGNDKVIVQYTYYPTGLLKRTDNGNGTYTTYDYTPTGQVKSLVNYAPNGSVNSRFDYTYDDLDRVATMTTLEGVRTYGYDGIGQLTSVQLPNGRKIQYQYDANGNRIAVTDNGTTTAYTSNNRNQYVTVGGVTYGYDADGNMISKQDSSGLTTYTYDDQNRLIKVDGPDGTWTYEYDVFGNRRATTHNGQRTEYLLDPAGLGDVVGEYNGSGGLIAHYTYGLGLTNRVDMAGVAAYYDFDAIGSTVGITNPAGSYTARGPK